MVRKPPRFFVVPAACLLRHDVPYHLRMAYATLYALAWNNGYRFVDYSTEEIAAYWTEVEGQELSPAGARRRLEQMAECGMIERQRRGPKAARTIFLWRHETSAGSPPQREGEATHPTTYLAQAADQPPAATADQPPAEDPDQPAGSAQLPEMTATPSSSHCRPGQMTATPSSSHLSLTATPRVAIKAGNINSTSGDGGESTPDESPPPLILLLTDFGVHEDVAESLAARGVTLEQAQGWIDYARRERSVHNPVGFVVAKLGRGVPPPPRRAREREDPRRYIQGEYAEYILW